MIRFGISIVFLLAVLLAVLLAIDYVEALFLRDVYPVLPQEIDKYDNSSWVEVFQFWALCGAIAASVLAFVWFCIGQFMLKVEHYSDAGGRIWWGVLLLFLLLLTIIAGFIFIPATQDYGKPMAMGFYLINAFFIYWFSSVMFSPSNVKYAPLFSKNLAVPANGIIKTIQGAEK